MAQTLQIKINGLYTLSNDLSEAPPGSLLIANNVVLDRDSILEPRRGFRRQLETFGSTNERANKIFEYQDRLLINYGNGKMAYLEDLQFEGSGQASNTTLISTTPLTTVAAGIPITGLEIPPNTTVSEVFTEVVTIGTLTTSSATITNIPDTAEIKVGQAVTGTGIPADTYVSSIVSSSILTITNLATDLGVQNLTFEQGLELSNPLLDDVSGETYLIRGWFDYAGLFPSPDPNLLKTQSTTANNNFYFTSSAGIGRIDRYDSTPARAGGIRALDATISLVNNFGFFVPDSQIAYRITWSFRDRNNNLLEGAPSQRAVIVNESGGTNRNVNLSILIPDGITTDYIYRVYRSGFSADENSTPDDELQLVYEDSPTSAEIAAGEIQITDITPNDLRGATLYTSPSQQGIINANTPPPISKDIATFKGSTFYANTKTEQTLNLNIISVSGDQGIRGGDTITIAGVTYTYDGGIPEITEVTVTSSSTISAASYFTINSAHDLIEYYVWYEVGLAGSDPALLGKQPIKVEVGAAEAASSVAQKTAQAINAVSAFEASASGDVVTVTNFDGGDTTDATAATSGFSITVTQQGVDGQEVASSNVVKLVTDGTPAQNIAETALSLVRIINRSPQNTTIYATYNSNVDELPGRILLFARTPGLPQFFITSDSASTAYNPSIPTGGRTRGSTNDEFKNALFFSKPLEPEAVPQLNVFRVGSADKQILRILPLRDSLFILKEDGIFRLTGEAGNFLLEEFDSTARLIGPETAVLLNNQIFMLSDQGVVSVSDTGIPVLSRDIEDSLLGEFSQNLESTARSSFGISYESERKYILFTTQSGTGADASQALVYNFFTKAWTRWPLLKTTGYVFSKDDRLYLGDFGINALDQERKTRTFLDYAEEEFEVTVTDVNERELTLASLDNVEIGDVISQPDGVFSLIVDIDPDSNTVIIKDFIPEFEPGNAILLKGIETEVQFIPQTGKNPGYTKQFRDISFLFKEAYFDRINANFESELSRDPDSVTLRSSTLGLWGQFPWGEVPWGGEAEITPLRTYIPRNKQRCSQLKLGLSHREAYSFYRLSGFSLIFKVSSERLRR